MPISLQNAHPWASLSWRQVALGSVFQALGCGHHRVRARTRPPTGGHRGQLSRVAFGWRMGNWSAPTRGLPRVETQSRRHGLGLKKL